MTDLHDGELDEIGLRRKQNTAANIAYYRNLADFFKSDAVSDLTKVRSFSVYSPRQVVSDFLARYELFKMIRDVQGSILEFGVFAGQGLMSFAHFSAILEPNNLNREIVGFDTFAGFPGIDEQDQKGDTDVVKEGGLRAESYQRLLHAISLFDDNRFLGHVPKVRLVKGDVLQTLDEFVEGNQQLLIALLYMDLDVYRPTKFVLERLLKRLPKGGIVAFDELNHRAFPGETAALLDVIDVRNVEVRRIPFCSRISYFVV